MNATVLCLVRSNRKEVMDNWLEIIPPLPRQQAIERLLAWKQQQEARGIVVNDDDLREDVMVAELGRDLYRYCVRRP